MKLIPYLKISFLALVVIVGPSTTVYAQNEIDALFNDGNLSLRVSPEIPDPNTNVTLSIESFSTNLGKADIKWEVNGLLVKRGVGLVTFQVKTGAVGSVTQVKISAQTKDGSVLTENITLRPGLVDIIWQADSWTPPFYKGRGMPLAKTKLTAQAIPYMFDGKTRIPSKNLDYQWFYDFEPLQSQSGIGKDTVSVESPDLFGQKNLMVKVASLDGGIIANEQISLTPSEPLALVWRDDPLSGLDYDHPTGSNISLTGDEISFETGGIYFPKTHMAKPGLIYRWTQNAKPALVDAKKPNSIIIRNPEGGGEGQINIDIQDPFDTIISDSKSFFIKTASKNF